MEKTSVFPKSLFGSPRQTSILSSSSPSYSSSSSCSSPSSSSSLSSSSSSIKPQRLSFNLRGGASFPSHSPKPEGRSRSGTTVEPLTTTRKRTNTLTSTVDSLTLFWEGKKEFSDKDKKKEKEKEKEKSTKPRSGSILFGKSPQKPIFKEPAKKDNDKEPASQLPTLKETKTQRDIKREIPDIRTEGSNALVSMKEDYKMSKNRSSKLRSKQKAKSEGSLISVLFSKKLNDRSGFLQKSSSLIELKQTSNTQLTTKSGSSLQLGQIKRGYFGTTLQEAMVLQLEKFPEFRLPVIVVKLTEAILYFHGNTVEGIFRVAGSTQQVSKLQQQLNELNYDEMSTDPHVLVGVLKQWFRELKEPLIPNDNYQECIRCETHADSVRAVGNLPPLNKATFEHLVIFLRQLSKPENQKYTKMDLHSLCVVSAPMLFRCPTTDMTELMVNMQKEKSFLSLVLESSAFCC